MGFEKKFVSTLFSAAFLILWLSFGRFCSATQVQDSTGTSILDSLAPQLPRDTAKKDSLFIKYFPEDSSLSNLSQESKINLINEVDKELQASYEANLKQFESRKNYLFQTTLVSNFRTEINSIKRILTNSPDFRTINKELQKISDLIPMVQKGIADPGSKLISNRNLSVSYAIFSEISQKVQAFKKEVEDYSQELRLSHYRADSMTAMPEFYQIPIDTLEALQFAKEITEISVIVRPINDSLKSRREQIDETMTVLNELTFTLTSITEAYDYALKNLNQSIFNEQSPTDPQDGFYNRSFWEVLGISYQKEKVALLYYLELNSGRLFWMILLLFSNYAFINRLKSKTKDSLDHDPIDENNLILKSPISAAIILTIGVFQFFFFDPPFIFYWILWLIGSIALTFLFIGFLQKFWKIFWICTVFFFLSGGLVNMMLIPSFQEKHLMIAISSVAVFFLIYLIFSKKADQLKERKIVFFIWLLGIFEFISIVLNLSGKFNLAKSFMVSGYMGIVLGIYLLWTVRLINQGLNLAKKIYSTSEKDLFFINFDKIGSRAPGIFYFFLGLGWVILIGKNFYIFSRFVREINQFLTQERVIGSYTFSINGIFIFLIILFISVLISRLLSLFSADPDAINSEEQRKRISFGSWLLLVQIFIICLGLFLAFAASGIPLDKITIILGALSVGIGLGLQGLVNNLVSGLIIAFENTVKVGDLIEIEGKPGIMKSIGFRSSVVNMFEGSTVVIPNGELISQKLINWTTGKGRKLTLIIGISYESDLEKALALLKGIIAEDSRIRHLPNPRVVPVEFADSSIEIEVSIWLNNYFDFPFVKGDIVSKTNEQFKLNGIKIPFPQRDLHWITPPKSSKEEE